MNIGSMHHSLLEHSYPKAVVSYCSAAPLQDQRGGRERWRISFPESDSSDPFHQVAIRASGKSFCLCQQGYHRFTTLDLDGKEQVVWIHDESLKARFNVPDRLFRFASANDDLSRIVHSKRWEQELIDQAKKKGGDYYISAKVHNLRQSIFVNGDFVAYKKRKSLIGKGGFAKVKEVIVGEKTLARRTVVLNPLNRERTFRTLELLKNLQGKVGIISLIAFFRYRNCAGEDKVVMIFPRFQQDLLTFFNSEKLRLSSKSVRLGYVRQLLVGLSALDGTHGDLTAENVLLDGEKLAINDFEFFRRKNETDQRYPQTIWSPPELKSGIAMNNEKMDVWSAGLFLCFFFDPDFKPFHWMNSPGKVNSYTQKGIDGHLGRSNFSDKERYLVGQMLKLDPKERFTIAEALDYFNRNILIENCSSRQA